MLSLSILLDCHYNEIEKYFFSLSLYSLIYRTTRLQILCENETFFFIVKIKVDKLKKNRLNICDYKKYLFPIY